MNTPESRRLLSLMGLRLFNGSTEEITLQAGFGDNGGITTNVGGAIGTGSFGTATSYSSETRMSNDVELADLNGDGFLDIVTSGTEDVFNGFATVRLGDGDGSFGQATSYASESNTSNAVKLADLNNDGVLDLITAGRTDGNSGAATVRLGDGNGSFGAATSFATESGNSLDLALEDLNGDGALDLITAGGDSSFDGYSTVRLGDGTGSFGVATSYSTESSFSQSVALADLNGDNILDLVTGGGSDGGDGFATVRLGDGTGSFGSAVSFATEGQYTHDLALEDLNSDGFIDLITTGRDDSNVGYATVRLGDGSGSFGGSTSFSTQTGGSAALQLGDVNGDGLLDLLTAGHTDGFDGYATVRLGESVFGVGPLVPFSLETMAEARQALPVFKAQAKPTSRAKGNYRRQT